MSARESEDTILSRMWTLPRWTSRSAFSESDWRNYVQRARQLQTLDDQVVEAVLERFMQLATSDTLDGSEPESIPFILMRIVFDLPESAPSAQRRSFKGWTNWPEPNAVGIVSLAWPVSWELEPPRLVADYEGSEGRPYAAASEYAFLRRSYPLRNLDLDKEADV